MIGEVVLEKVGVGREDFDHRLGEPLHVSVPDAGVEALQLLQHLEALGQLREHVHHRAREVRVLSVLPELKQKVIKKQPGQLGPRFKFAENILCSHLGNYTL